MDFFETVGGRTAVESIVASIRDIADALHKTGIRSEFIKVPEVSQGEMIYLPVSQIQEMYIYSDSEHWNVAIWAPHRIITVASFKTKEEARYYLDTLAKSMQEGGNS